LVFSIADLKSGSQNYKLRIGGLKILLCALCGFSSAFFAFRLFFNRQARNKGAKDAKKRILNLYLTAGSTKKSASVSAQI
jgi:hypothetical protein